MTNYCPISILILIHKHSTNFFQKNSVLCDTQYGFQSNLSTFNALLDILTSTCDQSNAGNYTGLILLDFKKAFDTVCHKILLRKSNIMEFVAKHYSF